jgi:hypothetical protein
MWRGYPFFGIGHALLQGGFYPIDADAGRNADALQDLNIYAAETTVGINVIL